MPVRRLLAVGLWFVLTASATAIVWAGTSTVAADLTDRPAPVVAHRDVVSALQSGDAEAGTTPGITRPEGSSSTSTVPSPRRDSARRGAGAPAPGAPEPAAPVAGVAPTVAPAPPPGAPAPPSPRTPPTTQAPQRPTATYSTPGGVVTVACTGYFFIDLVSATPSNGYAVRVATAGPYYVEVHFIRGGEDMPVWAYCLGQPVRAYDGPPRQGQAPRPS